MFTRRSPIAVLVLTFFTCGIYGFFWLYNANYELKRELKNDNNPGLEIVVSILTCGLFSIYLVYRMGKQLVEVQKKHGCMENDVSIVNILLSVFGLYIVALAITQDVMNKCMDEKKLDTEYEEI